MRFSRPRAPISFPAIVRRLREDLHVNPERYERLGDYLLFAGAIAVLALSVYILIFAG